MNEALLNMFGVSIAEPEGVKFAERVLMHMRERLVEFQEETRNLYNLEATPLWDELQACPHRQAQVPT